jgi:hypothetical protein
MVVQSNLLVQLVIQNTKGMDTNTFEMLRSDVAMFLYSLAAKVKVNPKAGNNQSSITSVFEIKPSQETAVNNYIQHERDLDSIANVSVQFDPIQPTLI